MRVSWHVVEKLLTISRTSKVTIGIKCNPTWSHRWTRPMQSPTVMVARVAQNHPLFIEVIVNAP